MGQRELVAGRCIPLVVLLALQGSSCTALLGVEDAVLDEGSTGTSTTNTTGTGEATSSSTGPSTSSGGGAPSSSSAGGGTASTGSGGEGGAGAATSSSGTGGGASSSASSGGGDTSSSSGGGGGAGGAGGDGSASSSSGTGGAGGGASSSSGTGGAGGGASSSSSTGGSGGGGGEPCALPALPRCPGVQANTFSLAADLSDHWDVLAPQASITAGNELQLRVGNGTNEARIQAKVALDAPTSCGAWIRFALPNANANVESGLGVDSAAGLLAIFHVEGEVRVRDAQGGIAVVPFDPVNTARVRARFDANGDLWFDTSSDGACWAMVDGPFPVDDGPLDLQVFVARPGTSGNATSTFDDFSL